MFVANSKTYLRALTYHLNENAAIGKAYENEYIIDDCIEVDQDNVLLVGDLDDPYKFYMAYHHDPNSGGSYERVRLDIVMASYSPKEGRDYLWVSEGIESDRQTLLNWSPAKLKMTNNNKYCVLYGNLYGETGSDTFIFDISDGTLVTGKPARVFNSDLIETINDKLYNIITQFNQVNNNLHLPFVTIYEASSTTVNPMLSFKVVKTAFVNVDIGISAVNLIITPKGEALITNDNKKFIFMTYYSEQNSIYENVWFIVVNLDDIFALDYGTEGRTLITPIQEDYMSSGMLRTEFRMLANRDSTKILIPNAIYVDSNTQAGLVGCINKIDKNNLIGLKYKGKKFYELKEDDLTATTEDVRKYKTFIGQSGLPETGTMEVTE